MQDRNYGSAQFRPSPELSARIQARIDAIQPISPDAGWLLGEWPVRVCKEEMGALPIHSDPNFIWALRPDGTLLSLDHVEFRRTIEAETDPFALFAALLCGARRYPELAELTPAPPAAARSCRECAGSGRKSAADGEDAAYCEVCNGVKWFLAGPLWPE